jgi:hypothetical protein
VLVPSGDADALVDAILRLEDPAERATLSAGARRSSEQYSIGPATARLEAVYGQVAGAA